MSMSITCPRCDVTIDAKDEAELVAMVQRHVRVDHGLEHTLPPKHILARLRRMPDPGHDEEAHGG